MSKLIAVWGSPNSGKTSFAVKLALSIYNHLIKTVLVLHTDMITPVLPVLFPGYKPDDLYSIGTTLSKTDITQTELLKNIVSVKEKVNLGFLGFKDGENRYTYPRFDEIKAIALLTIMKDLADYVIIDCTSNPDNVLSLATISQSDTVIRLATPDLKSMSFYSSQLPLYADPKYDIKEHIQGLQIRDNDLFLPIDEVKVYFKEVQFVLPYCKEIKQQMLDGKLLDKITNKKYNSVLQAITDKVV
jgi:cellulose biosynthesis protein BcsQ